MRGEMNLYGLIFLLISGTILSSLAINIVIIQYGVTNDYIFVTLQNLSEDLGEQGLYTNSINITNMTLSVGQAYQDTINWLDNIWFAIYIGFIMMTFFIAYRIKSDSEISFFMVMLYGIFIFSFVGWLTDVFISWFTLEVTLKLLPNALEFFPKFEWFTNNIGIINVCHAVILLILSRINFQYALGASINKQELESLDEDELS